MVMSGFQVRSSEPSELRRASPGRATSLTDRKDPAMTIFPSLCTAIAVTIPAEESLKCGSVAGADCDEAGRGSSDNIANTMANLQVYRKTPLHPPGWGKLVTKPNIFAGTSPSLMGMSVGIKSFPGQNRRRSRAVNTLSCGSSGNEFN